MHSDRLGYNAPITVVSRKYYTYSDPDYTIGVTVLSRDAIEDVVVRVDRYNAPYIMTKPLHHSQTLVEKEEGGSCVFSMRVHNNFELRRLLLGFAAGIEVVSPRRLRGQLKKSLRLAYEQYC